MTLTVLPKGVFKRGAVYVLRFTVPVELRPAVGKREIIRSLGSSDLGEALSRRRETLEEIKASLFAKYDGPQAVSTPETSQDTTVRATSHRWLAQSDGIKPSTKERYRRILQRFETFTGNAEVSKITRRVALAHMDDLRSTPSERTGQPGTRPRRWRGTHGNKPTPMNEHDFHLRLRRPWSECVHSEQSY
ncbi:DUF6538 domain-containing protein [Rhodovulum kholense]|uniref:DUF6538 domain-containing protein n=1 Tax=Rhodovulum kholense TaxID=453584 RepID=UPI0011B1D400|nr:DUF6538 domain-containing protein [Rhodovulum kholense]